MDDIELRADSKKDLFDEVNSFNLTYYLPNSTLKYLEDCIESLSPDTPPSYCPNIFDSVICFQATPPNSTQFSPCPRSVLRFTLMWYLYFADRSEHHSFNAANQSAEKICNADGTWWLDPRTNMTYSNYIPCVPRDKFAEHMATLNTVGNCLSLILLGVSLLIFTIFSSSLNYVNGLFCGRINMHKHLFLARSLRKSSTFTLL